LISSASESHSEDCLYLNVWTPAADGRRRPVMVWIHGGAFVMGSGSTPLYRGARLAERGDLVVVTINYRMGALGFLNHPGLASAEKGVIPNLGMRDQVLALEWVRDNIEGFGGDPENVTIFGESAGGMSVGTLLGAPAARGLFHRAILQSGAAHNVSSRERAYRVAEDFLSQMGLESSDVEALRGTSLNDILEAQSRTTIGFRIPLGFLAWQPSIDGDLLPSHPLDAIAGGVSRAVPVLVGSNRDEWKLFMFGDRDGRKLDRDGLRQRLERILPGVDANGTAEAEVALDTYRHALPHSSSSERWVAFQSDRIFHYPAVRVAELQSAHNPQTFRYLFTWSPPALGFRIGACHGLEIPFVFGTLRDPFLRPTLGLTRDARHLSRRMQDAWIAFARNGDPGHDALPDWAPYDVEDRTMMLFGTECFPQRMRVDPRSDFWQTRLYRGKEPTAS
jgi:para-nitrobenzyl esterase